MSNPRSPRGGSKGGPKDLKDGTKNPYVRYRPLKKPKLEPQATTLWDFPSQHYGTGQQGSANYRGATPSYVIWNVLQLYSQPGDVVLDPFCGSGTTLDVCKDTDRKGIGFDLQAMRDDVGTADARDLPLDDKSVDLAFLDPPYADNLVYSDDDRCIGKTMMEDGSYLEAMEEVFEELLRVVKDGGIIAVYVQDILKKKSGQLFPLGAALLHLGSLGFDIVDHVCVVRRNKDLEKGNYKKAALEEGFMLRGFNHLLVFRVPDDNPPKPKEQRRPKPSSTEKKPAAKKAPAKKSPAKRGGSNRGPRKEGGRGGKPAGKGGPKKGPPKGRGKGPR